MMMSKVYERERVIRRGFTRRGNDNDVESVRETELSVEDSHVL